MVAKREVPDGGAKAHVSFEKEFLAAAQSAPDTSWRTLDEGRGTNLRFTLRCPSTWLEGVTPDRRLGHQVIQPPSARLVHIGGKPMSSPCVTVVTAQLRELRDDAVLDQWASTRAQQFQGYRLRESIKTTIHGVRALVMFHDFAMGNETWSCMMVLRVVGNAMWYADANGRTADLASLRPQVIGVLASLRMT